MKKKKNKQNMLMWHKRLWVEEGCIAVRFITGQFVAGLIHRFIAEPF
jgi:hypothetical protein